MLAFLGVLGAESAFTATGIKQILTYVALGFALFLSGLWIYGKGDDMEHKSKSRKKGKRRKTA